VIILTLNSLVIIKDEVKLISHNNLNIEEFKPLDTRSSHVNDTGSFVLLLSSSSLLSSNVTGFEKSFLLAILFISLMTKLTKRSETSMSFGAGPSLITSFSTPFSSTFLILGIAEI